ncbi:LLM class flavin-dependent oxidoreductase [Tessaracoccus antarcticus]|uniref:LLM class flavin-dependent oxidoreductase n=1 Tax=Tessaracoccus antarcticus TaxID=2479848 RepID=A0A3M0G7G9_9ACTN|nr:LLM class flavin-dependent oxidoreductase [Tessaracoccus antarcticus]RMB58322.1 LLM class flavin-dependent oxidoreductase [Tessaracoccus antarcticus]
MSIQIIRRSTERWSEDIEFGVHTFGDVTVGDGGKKLGHPEVLRNVVAEGVLADQVGLDVMGIGEHHRPDYAISAPDVVLTAIAAQTQRIKLISAVTVLSSDDPVRVYERFATLDAISSGRAEVSLGRGSFTESFPLFGFELRDYEQLYSEKLDLFSHLRSEGPVTWSGTTRSGLSDQRIFPTTDHEHGLPTWVAVGGTPESVVRAAKYGFGLELAIIGGQPARFAPFAELFREALAEFGQGERRIAIHSHGFIADTDEEAMNRYWPHYEASMRQLGRERGWAPPTRARFEAEVRDGALHVGSPDTVAKKVASTISALGATRFGMKYGNGTLPHADMMRAVELYGTKVKPMVLDMLSEA